MQTMPRQPGTIHALPLNGHMHTAVPSPHSGGTLEGVTSGGKRQMGQKFLGITRNKVNAHLCAKHSAVHCRGYKASHGDKTGIEGTEAQTQVC